MKRALISIDYTNDFVADNGALTCGRPAQDIESEIVKVTKEFILNEDYVVFAIDNHLEQDKFHPENKFFPPHNINGTNGRMLYGEMAKLYTEHKAKENVYWLDKTRYSAFAGTDLLIKLRERDINTLHFTGVCTDICVLHSMVDAYNLGFKLLVHQDAVASFNATGHKWALEHFKNCMGAKII